LTLSGFSPNGADGPAIFAIDARDVRRIDTPAAAFSLDGLGPAAPSAASVVPLDWNRDYRMDLAIAGRSGVRLLIQGTDGTFTDATAEAGRSAPLNADCFGVWAADLEMDGDLDIGAGLADAEPVVLRNNGDGTWRVLRPFPGVVGLRAFAWGDLDGDGDADAALLDAAGNVHVFENRQAGQFREIPAPTGLGNVLALTLGGVNTDGVLDLAALKRRCDPPGPASRGGGQRASPYRRGNRRNAAWPDRSEAARRGRLGFLADLDNSGRWTSWRSGGLARSVADAKGTFQLLPRPSTPT
jgi:hypothetical protein